MITLRVTGFRRDLDSLLVALWQLPGHIARKHLKAAIRRALKPGVPILKSITPKGGTKTVRSAVVRDKGGRFQAGSGKKVKQRGGALRRAATSLARVDKRDGTGYGVLGFKAGMQSRKAIWLEFGTSRGVTPRKIIAQLMTRFGGPARQELTNELRNALQKATKELASGKSKGGGGYRRR